MEDITGMLAQIAREELELRFVSFDEDTAWALGQALARRAQERRAPVVLNIRSSDRTYFHLALPGATPDNDLWAQRKSNTTLHLHRASLAVGAAMRAKGQDPDSFGLGRGLDPLVYSAHGGSFPIRLTKGPVLGAITVSGLPQIEDHALIVETLRGFLA
ncbi:heme-degrading domain-containing protein [Phaeovulum sp. W22_SRMD_FR3]|uniref:heme-degrading domain-containing protein n=1 Tax=Phaeovulum sp. W22_SRMD_FR3 TaxID=3240274 RepID=UPI003F9BBA02